MRHIKRYEEVEQQVPSTPIKVKHPVFEREDHVPYPREEDEDRSYEQETWERTMLLAIGGYSLDTVDRLVRTGRAGEEIFNSTGQLFSQEWY